MEVCRDRAPGGPDSGQCPRFRQMKQRFRLPMRSRGSGTNSDQIRGGSDTDKGVQCFVAIGDSAAERQMKPAIRMRSRGVGAGLAASGMDSAIRWAGGGGASRPGEKTKKKTSSSWAAGS